MKPTYLLIMAKAPVPATVKTRLCPPASVGEAADIAAAALLDTLDAATGVGLPVVVAIAGDLTAAKRGAEIVDAMRDVPVLAQRGDGLAQRLSHAHADAAQLHPGAAVLQIGGDTPQVTSAILADSAETLSRDGLDAVLGPATDGGWWALGLRDPAHAQAIRDVAMSTPDTGELTGKALLARGLRVGSLPQLCDVDTMADAVRVARDAPHGGFAAAVSATLRSHLGE